MSKLFHMIICLLARANLFLFAVQNPEEVVPQFPSRAYFSPKLLPTKIHASLKQLVAKESTCPAFCLR